MTTDQTQNPEDITAPKAERGFHFVFPKQSRLRKAFEPMAETASLLFTREKDRHAFGTCVDTQNRIPSFDASIKKPGVTFRKINEGRADMAVVGLDKYIEERCRAEAKGAESNMRIAASFNIASCAMYVAATPETPISSPQELCGKRIATSYPYSLSAWLKGQGVGDFEIIECDGDTEDEIRDGSADAIFEIVDSGQSLIDNGLERKIWAYNIQAVLIERKGTWTAEQTQTANIIKERLSEASAALRNAKTGTNSAQPDQNPAQTLFLDLGAA